MRKIFIPIIILLLCSIILIGCSSNSTSTTPTTPAVTQAATSAPAVTAPPTATTTAATKPASPTSTTTAPSSPVTSPVSGGQKYGGTLRWIEFMGPGSPIGWPSETSGPSGFSPQISAETLIEETKDGTLKPRLASSWDVVTNAANPSITFHLQKGVKFHDGTDFNAQAVKWNLDQIMKASLYTATVAAWKSVEVLDDYTIRVNLKVWQNSLVRNFADQMVYQISPTAYDKNGLDWMRWHIVGTGPYIMTDFQRDVVLTGTKNPNYWQKGKPYLDKIQLLFVVDEMSRIALFKSGGADILNTNSQGKVASDMKAAGYNIVSLTSGPMSLIPDSSNADSPWSNIKVRQAAEYAIDKESMASTLGGGWWTAAYQFSPSISKAYDPAITGRKYDVAKAKQLLTEAGYPNGFKTTIAAGPLFLNRDVLVAAQAYLAKIGIQAELQIVDSAKWNEINQNPWKNMLLYTSINLYGNQNYCFNYYFATPPALYKSVMRPEGFNDLLQASRTSPEQDPVMLKKLENMVYDNSMIIPIYNNANIWALNPYVMDSGVGQHGIAAWFDPEGMWFNK